MSIRVISYGGGVQSTALVVLATQGRLDDVMGGPVDAALFANVGDDSEHPDTLEYVRNIAVPWAAERGLPIHELHRYRKGEIETLYGRLTRGEYRGTAIPVRGEKGNPLSRDCTADYKVAVLNKWLGANGATKDDPGTCAIGISTDEIERAGRGKDSRYERRVYPLLDLGLNRADCMRIITDAGLPVPRPSSCYFCPYHSRQSWKEMRRDEPELFAKVVDLEEQMNRRLASHGKTPVWFSDALRPLSEAVIEAQPSLLDGPDSCGSGSCWT
jgi:hypothetical protein